MVRVTLGKVEAVEISGKRVVVRLIENPMCFYLHSIRQEIEDSVLVLPGIEKVKLERDYPLG